MKELLMKILGWLKTGARYLGEVIGILEKATKQDDKPKE